MSEQEQNPQGSIPPKATPAAPGAPRPITVRLKPVAPSAAAPAASEPAKPVPAPLSSSPRLTARVPIPDLDDEDSAPTLSTMMFPVPSQATAIPMQPTAPAVAAPAPAPVAAAAPAAPAAAAPAPAAVAPAPAAAPATVRLRPVIQPAATMPPPAAPAAAPAAAAPAVTPVASPLQPVHPPTPGSHPLPDGPKPPSSAQVQAAKSKTSRISLDSAIGVAPMSPMGAEKAEPKTIRLKRPADLAAPPPKVSTAPIRQTSRIPDSVLPAAEPAAAAADSTSVTQKKTLKIKRPGGKDEAAAAAAPAEGGESFPEGVALTPLSPIDLPVKEESKVFTTIALIAAILALCVMGALVYCLLAHGMGPDHGANSLASVGGPKLGWAGTID